MSWLESRDGTSGILTGPNSTRLSLGAKPLPWIVACCGYAAPAGPVLGTIVTISGDGAEANCSSDIVAAAASGVCETAPTPITIAATAKPDGIADRGIKRRPGAVVGCRMVGVLQAPAIVPTMFGTTCPVGRLQFIVRIDKLANRLLQIISANEFTPFGVRHKGMVSL